MSRSHSRPRAHPWRLELYHDGCGTPTRTTWYQTLGQASRAGERHRAQCLDRGCSYLVTHDHEHRYPPSPAARAARLDAWRGSGGVASPPRDSRAPEPSGSPSIPTRPAVSGAPDPDGGSERGGGS